MKETRSASHHSDPLVLSRTEYMRLSSADQGRFRPINPRYERLPTFCRILYAIAVACIPLYVLQRCIPSFADFFNLHISSICRMVLAYATGWIPFSVAECLLLSLPLILGVTVRYAIRRRCDTWRCVVVFIAILLSVLVSLGSLFVLTFSAGYYGLPLQEKMELDTGNIQDDELYDTANALVVHLNQLHLQITYDSDGLSVMPYSLSEMNDRLMDSYASLHDTYAFMPWLSSRVKPVLLSEGMSYLHTTGLYSFFTGESNINVAFPDFTIPYTAAHELAHQRGVAREDEANFVAFLACTRSNDPYLQYCGYLNMFQYVAGALYEKDGALYRQLYQTLSTGVQQELIAYNRFFEKYENSTAGDVSAVINNAYLQSQGTEGTISYNLVVRLTVGLYRQERQNTP